MSLLKIIQAVRGPDGLEPRDSAYFSSRIAHAAGLDGASAQAYLQRLIEPGPADEDLPRAEAITLLALAQPAAAETLGLNTVECATQTASALQDADRGTRALGLLEAAWAACDRAPALLRAIETLRVQQRRAQRQLHDLLARAEKALRASDFAQASVVLEEARALDPDGVPVKRIAASIERHRQESKRKRTQRTGLLIALAALLGLGWVAVDWERDARSAFASLPAADPDELDSVSQRLVDLEAFVSRYPVWTGALDALEERAELRIKEKALLDRQVADAQRSEREAEQRLREAEFAYREGKRLFEIGQFDAALREMERALELGQDGWDRADRVARDKRAIEEFLLQEDPR